MIIHPCTSLFDCKYPELEPHEEEVFYQHPLYSDIKCNQLGVLYYDEDKYYFSQRWGNPILWYTGSNKDNVGGRYKITWECYHGRVSPGLVNLFDMNPYNCTKDNLYVNCDLKKSEYAERIKYRRRFIYNTVMQLEAFAERHPYMTPGEIMSELNLQRVYRTAWTSHLAGVRVKVPTEPINKPYTKPRPDDDERVKALFFSGATQLEIARAMDWGSTMRVRNMIKKHGWKKE